MVHFLFLLFVFDLFWNSYEIECIATIYAGIVRVDVENSIVGQAISIFSSLISFVQETSIKSSRS